MNDRESPFTSWPRAIAIGLTVAVLTALVMMILTKSGLSPLPKPLGLAFAETLFGRVLPLPVGLLFHSAYVVFWSLVWLRFFQRQSLQSALILSGMLWLGVLVVFFPVVGWGFAGLNVTPRLIPASLLPHVLFGLLLWALHRRFPGKPLAAD